jgi:hypothetical protein
MDQEWSFDCLSDSVHAQHMIKMGMSRDDTRWGSFDVSNEPQDSPRLVAWINNDGFAARLENVAVSLQPSNN